MRAFGDGRVGAILALGSPASASPVHPIFFVFERVGDRWLIAGWPDTGFTESSDDGIDGPSVEAILAPTPTPAAAA